MHTKLLALILFSTTITFTSDQQNKINPYCQELLNRINSSRRTTGSPNRFAHRNTLWGKDAQNGTLSASECEHLLKFFRPQDKTATGQ